jgi:hypothetical protein
VPNSSLERVFARRPGRAWRPSKRVRGRQQKLPLIAGVLESCSLPGIVKAEQSDESSRVGETFSRPAEMLTSGVHPLRLRTCRDLALCWRPK